MATMAVSLRMGTAEVVRRQADSRWLYVIDYAAALSLPAGRP